MKLHKYDITSATPLELIPNATSAFLIGQAIKLANGTAAACAATDKPIFICMKNSAADDLEPLPVVRVNPHMELAAELSAAGTSLKAGDAVTLATDGVRVTATTTKGVFTITGFEDGNAVGDTVYGRILDADTAAAG